jgi:hypothetical protein
MIITVKHTISDPDQFWSRAQESLPNLPEGIKIHSVMPDDSMTNAICVWEANDVEHLKEYLEGKTGDVAHNDYMAVNEKAGMGIPGK